MAVLFVGVQYFIQKDFVYDNAYSKIIYNLSKPSQSLRSAEVVSEVADGQKNLVSACKLCFHS